MYATPIAQVFARRETRSTKLIVWGRSLIANHFTWEKVPSVQGLVEKIENNDPTSTFYKHPTENRDANHPNLCLEILSVHPGDAMLRQIAKSVYIKNYEPDLNNKEE